MSLPVESSKPTAIGINVGSLTDCPGVGGISWLQICPHQTYYQRWIIKNRSQNLITITQSERNEKLKSVYLIFKENVCPSAL